MSLCFVYWKMNFFSSSTYYARTQNLPFDNIYVLYDYYTRFPDKMDMHRIRVEKHLSIVIFSRIDYYTRT